MALSAVPKGSLLYLYSNVKKMKVLELRSSSEMMELLSLPLLEYLEIKYIFDNDFDKWDWQLFPQPAKLHTLKFPYAWNVSGNSTFRDYLLKSTIEKLTMNAEFFAFLQPLENKKVFTRK